MKILVFHHKYGDLYYDATNEDRAFLACFYFIDKQLQYYRGIESSTLDKARDGDEKAAKRWLSSRAGAGYEYEDYDLIYVADPEEEISKYEKRKKKK